MRDIVVGRYRKCNFLLCLNVKRYAHAMNLIPNKINCSRYLYFSTDTREFYKVVRFVSLYSKESLFCLAESMYDLDGTLVGRVQPYSNKSGILKTNHILQMIVRATGRQICQSIIVGHISSNRCCFIG